MPTATSIGRSVAAGDVRAAEVLAACEARHRAVHSRLNALIQPRWPEAAAEALGIDAVPHGDLAGVPVSVKECFAVRGLRTTLGIAGRDVLDTHDATAVARLKAAGAIIVGKSNVPQAMYLHETDNPVWGRTRHPLAADRSPGGSSGGDAALVAAGVVPLGLGNDLAGSLRQPAHACGIAAIMPRTAVFGDGGGFDTMPHVSVVRPRAGFLAADVADLRLALRQVAPGAEVRRRSAGPLTIGWWDDSGVIPASPAVVRAVAEAVSRLRDAGATVVRLDAAPAREAAWLHLAILAADGGAQVRALYQGSRPMPGVGRLLRIAGLPRGLRHVVAAAARLAGRGLEAEALVATGPRTGKAFDRLLAARATLSERFAAVAEGCDAIVCPVSALPALRHGTAAQLVLAAAPCLLANLLDLPAGAVPVTAVRSDEEHGRGRSRDPVLRAAALADQGSRGLPVGVQVVGTPTSDEATVLDVMQAIVR